MRGLFQILLGVMALSFVACEVHTPYDTCHFDPAINGACFTNASEKVSCVVDNHPDCPERVCVTYQGDGPFCTKTCTNASACALGGSCEDFLNDGEVVSYCVDPEFK